MLPALSSSSTHQLHLDSNSTATQQQPSLQHSQHQQQQQQHQLQQHQHHRSVKRSASMIFRIEHLLPSTSRGSPTIAPTTTTTTTTAATTNFGSTHALSQAITTNATCSSATMTTSKRSKLPRATCNGVLLTQFTPKDTVSEAIPTYALMNCGSNANAAQSITAYCTLAEGALRMSPELLRRIKLSEDIHSYNALFELEAGGMVHVRIVRDVARDEELVAWFGEEVALLMSIPFLTPLNIQGNKRYTCHLCQLTFETPNPLKIHLALGCGRHSMDILWIRLHYALKASSYTHQHRQLLAATATLATATLATTQPSLHSPTAAPSSTSSVSPASSPQPAVAAQQASQQQQHRQQQHLRQQVHRFSAFKPVSPSIAFTAAVTTSSFSNPNVHTSTVVTPSTALSYLPSIASVSGALPHMHLLQPVSTIGGIGASNPLNAAAQIEAIVSNMGASKQGHLCIYCGKVYSRKYGLKIHIRTHTGFKPLKCKFCLRPFGDPSNLNKHIRLHMQSNVSSTANEGYKCTLCNKTLARRRDLQRHIETRHSGDGGSS